MSVLEKPQMKQANTYQKIANKNSSWGKMVQKRKTKGRG